MTLSFTRRSVVVCLIALCLVLIGRVDSANAASAPTPTPMPVRIAVAPFETVADELASAETRAARAAALPDFAKLLAGRLALRDLERLIVPSAWVAEPRFDPHAEQVRRWAHSAAVDTVIVGRVFSGANAGFEADRSADGSAGQYEDSGRTRRVEVVVRSGHSGAELFRREMSVTLADRAGTRSEVGWAAALDPLAAAILGDLGEDASIIKGQPDQQGPGSQQSGQPNVAASGSGKGGADDGESAGGLASKIDLSGFTSDAPIEINADEAEIVSRGEDRRLIFLNNVRVKQANILLLSDRLEADYRKGESEPRQLIARGHVKIDQGGRKARCDKAIYQREAQRLICQGHAELIQGCDVVRGESIEFDLAGDQAKVQGAASIVIRPDAAEGSPANEACAAGKGLM